MWAIVVVFVLLVVLGAPTQAASAIPAGFTLDEITEPLNQPVAFGFTPGGRLYVAEKRGTVQVFDSVDDPTPTQVIDVSADVHDYWDRGLLGLAVDPAFGSGSDFVYLLYTYDPGNSWGDDCDDPTGVGCLVNGRLSRFPINPNGTAGSQQELLVGRWCAQFPSHTIGDLAFTEDGHLLVSAGDGASFNYADHGQEGNPCGDPMGGSEQADDEGGALRSQDLRTSGDPVTYDGTVLRINKATGEAISGNPSDAQDSRIIAYGLRNPFRIAVRPNTAEVWVGDVGWGAWEEVNRIVDPGGSRENFGWPCYEGNNSTSAKHNTYDNLNVDICENLYAAGQSAVVAPHYARPHEPANTHPGCTGTGGAISGLAFYEGGRYPPAYDGALFIADYSIGCIRVMFPDAPFGLPNKNNIATFVGAGLDPDEAPRPVDLQIGPGGDLYYADIITGRIVRVAYNTGPTAVAEASPTTGSVPLQVQFDGTDSTDAEGDDLTYAWDLDGCAPVCQYDDSTLPQPTWTYTTPGLVTVGLLVSDGSMTDTHTVVINPVSNQEPVATISLPSSSLTWRVGDTINFSGSATDPVDGPLSAAALTWDVVFNHCQEGGACHPHPIQTFSGVASGSFTAPDHPYPSYLTIRLTATDQGGLSDEDSVDIQPQTSVVTIASSPTGLSLEVGVEGLATVTTPHEVTAIVGGSLTVNAPSPQSFGGTTYNFVSWSNGQAQTHAITVPSTNTSLIATYQGSGGGGGGGGGGVGVGGIVVVSDFDDVPNTHPYYMYITWLAEQRITLGCAENLFCPDSPVTRGQMASFLVRAFGLPRAESDRFTDIAGSVHQADINALVARGITFGCSTDRFCPDDPVTRAQMASFLVRTLILPSGPDLFGDDEGSLHEADINALTRAGVTFGCAPLKYCPDAPVTRAEMATFLFRSFNAVRD
jgi:glucose/arabinose dehydrogenase